MRGFQKGITLCSRTSGSALKVIGGVAQAVIWWDGTGGYLVGGWGGPLDFSVAQVQV